MAKFLKVRMKVSMAGKLPDGLTEFGYQPGQIVLVDKDWGETLILVGHAERAEKDEAITETAALGNNDYLEHDPRLLQRLNGVVPL